MKFKLLILFFVFTFLFCISGCNQQTKPVEPKQNNKDEVKFYIKDKHYVIGEEITLYGSFDDYIIEYEEGPFIEEVKEYTYIFNRPGDYKFDIISIEDGSIYQSVGVKVYNRFFSLDSTSQSVKVGESVEFWVYNYDELMETSLSDFSFKVNDENIAQIDGYKLTGLKAGDVTIEATSLTNELVKTTYKITVVDERNEAVVLSTGDKLGYGKIGEQMEVSLNIGKPSDYRFGTTNHEVIRVTEYEDKLVVTGVGEGVANITCINIENPALFSSYRFVIKDKMDVDYISRFIDLAYSQVGIKETGDNYQKYGKWYGNNGQPWCATFVSWCWYHAGLSNDLLLKYQGCSTGMQWCLEHNIFKYKEEYTPKTGDIVFFLSNGAGHTGIVAYCDGNDIYTIEGNRSNKVGIWRLSCDNLTITGYGVPHYPQTTKNFDYSWIKTEKVNNKYLWTQVTNGEPTV